jgi:SAM-dependent methyltransferase
MICKICESTDIHVYYQGPIRNGSFGNLSESVDVFECNHCKVKWHQAAKNLDKFYETSEYRNSVNGSDYLQHQEELYDSTIRQKLIYTGTEIWRNKTVADIGCGNGGFLDFIHTVAKDTIAIEPSEEFRKSLSARHHTYPYTYDALQDWSGKSDIVTSFDVFEHVEDNVSLINEASSMLKQHSGDLYIGVPTDYPVLRSLLGDTMNQFAFSIQQIWYHSDISLRILAQKAGFKTITIKSYQNYGLGNLISWLLYKKPKGDITFDFITETLDSTFRKEMSRNNMGDYYLLHAAKD